MFCRRCGWKNGDDANFCINCGSRIIPPVPPFLKKETEEEEWHSHTSGNESRPSRRTDALPGVEPPKYIPGTSAKYLTPSTLPENKPEQETNIDHYSESDKNLHEDKVELDFQDISEVDAEIKPETKVEDSETKNKEKEAETTQAPINQFDDDGRLILPVYDDDKPKSSLKWILAILAVAIITAGGIVGYYFYVNSDVPKEKLEAMEKFSLKFAEYTNDNQSDSIRNYYRDFNRRLNTVFIPVDNVKILPAEGNETYEVKYSPDLRLIVTCDDTGNIKVKESFGLYEYDSDKMEIARETGLWDSSLNDWELSERMRDRRFFEYIKKNYADGYYSGTEYEDYLSQKDNKKRR